MKATLEFSLPDDKDDLNLAMKASSYFLALTDVRDLLRARLKYGNLSEPEAKALQEIQDDLIMILNQREITL